MSATKWPIVFARPRPAMMTTGIGDQVRRTRVTVLSESRHTYLCRLEEPLGKMRPLEVHRFVKVGVALDEPSSAKGGAS